MGDRALLVGINDYTNHPGDTLYGCENDVAAMREYLMSRCGFAERTIRWRPMNHRWTRRVILEELDDLVRDIEAGDRLLFFYSGHGVQLRTLTPGREPDGFDEAICPCDVEANVPSTAIRDDEIHQRIQRIPAGARFIWISDCCHSGDNYRSIQGGGSPSAAPGDRVKTLSRGDAARRPARQRGPATDAVNFAALAACESYGKALETRRYHEPCGAFTYHLLSVLRQQGAQLDLEQLSRAVSAELSAAGFAQIPQWAGDRAVLSRPFFSAR